MSATTSPSPASQRLGPRKHISAQVAAFSRAILQHIF
jgi:hypothetical protein